MDETKIIKKCQQGELGGFAVLYDYYADKIYRFIYYKTTHRETAEDLTSQTFFKALGAVSSFDLSRGNFSSWLYRIARNLVTDYYRTRKNTEDISDVWDLSDESDPAADLDTRQKILEVGKYLKNIRPEHREIVIMRLWDELSYQEIAGITGRSVASCKMTFSRAMTRLREELAYVMAGIILLIINLF